MLGFFRRDPHERLGYQLYGSAVSAARDPSLYTAFGVPDTLDGRFDMIALHVVLLIRRLQALPDPGRAVAQAVFDAMFNDMDRSLREMGVGDLSVGKKVKKMWTALHGRAQAYGAALDCADSLALNEALVRNVWRGATTPQAGALAALTFAQAAHLGTQAPENLFAGRVSFLPPMAVAA